MCCVLKKGMGLEAANAKSYCLFKRIFLHQAVFSLRHGKLRDAG